MRGIDIASHQWDLDLSAIDTDFVIVKATQGNYYQNPYFKKHIEQGLSLGKKMGIYHYAGGCSALSEAKYFLAHIEDYIGKAILCLDWESGDNGNYRKCDEEWCTEFMDYVKEQTGITMFLYVSASYRSVFPNLLKTHPLWAAQYADYNKVYGYQDKPWNEGAYDCAIRQYTSQMWIDGWRSHLDANKAYITEAEWDGYATGGKTEAEREEEKLTVDELAQQVLNGKWGNGSERKEALTAAGYDYNAVQAEVNRLLSVESDTTSVTVSEDEITELAYRVINGDFGNGQKRVDALGEKYDRVQARVNEILGGC